MNSINVPIRGMHCASCEILIGEELKKVPGVNRARVNYKRGEAEIHYSSRCPSDQAIRSAVQQAGYEVGAKEKAPWLSREPGDYKDLARAAVILALIYLVIKRFGLLDINAGDAPETGVFMALLVGLVAGVSTCMALIGGLVLSLSARHAELHPEATPMQKFRPHLYFNLGRIGGYAALGGVIGYLGRAFSPSINTLGILTMVIGGVMIFFGLKLIEIFPALRDKTITLPSCIARIFGLHKEIKEYSHKNAMTTGALTFFLPCGFTQAMQLYAVSTGSFWKGMTIMGLFAIGTAPGLLGIGGLSSVFKGRRARVFFMTAGLAVIIVGWFNVANGSRLVGGVSRAAAALVPVANAQEVRMTQGGGGYEPNVLNVEVGREVRWIINSTSPFSCASSIVVPEYGISRSLKRGENVIAFTPTRTGEIPFSCSMGMFRGKFIVSDGRGQYGAAGGAAIQPQAGSCGAGGGCGCGGGGKAFPQTPGGTNVTSEGSYL